MTMTASTVGSTVTSAINRKIVIGNIDAATATALAEGLIRSSNNFAQSPFSWGVFFLGSAAFLAAATFGAAAIITGFIFYIN